MYPRDSGKSKAEPKNDEDGSYLGGAIKDSSPSIGGAECSGMSEAGSRDCPDIVEKSASQTALAVKILCLAA